MPTLTAVFLATLLVPTLVKANGFYHQEYNYQTSSSHYKNRELQHKNDDAGFYSKDGDLEGRLRPHVNAYSQHSEYVNPKMQHAYHTGIDRTSSFGQLHAQNRFTPDTNAAFSFVAPVHNYEIESNLRHVTAGLEAEMERELQRAVYDHYQRTAAYGDITQAQIEADRRVLEEELRRNVTVRLQEALKEQYGHQGIRGGNSYSIIEGRLQPAANYNNQELEDLSRRLEANLMKRLEQQIQSHYRVETAVHTQRNTYRLVNNNNNNNNYPGALQQRPHVYHQPYQPIAMVQQPQPLPQPQPQPMPMNYIPDSITTVATRVQTELNEHLNKILEDTQRRYFTENAFQSHAVINHEAILAQLQEELRANITFQLDEEIKRAYGFSNYVSTKYSVEDIENLRRQIENNLINRLNRDFLRQRDNFLQTYRVYQAPRPIPANHVQQFQPMQPMQPMNTVHFQGDINTLQRQIQDQLSRQLQRALMEQSYRQAHTYSAANFNPQETYQATLDQLTAELNRNLTKEWELLNLEDYQQGVQASQFADMRNQLQHDLMRQLQQGLQQSYSRYSSWSSSSSSSSRSSNAGNYRPVRGFDPSLYRSSGGANVLGEDCMMGDDPSVYQQSQTNDGLTQQTLNDDDLTQQVQTHDDLAQPSGDFTRGNDLVQDERDLTQQIEDDQDLTQQVQTHDDFTQQRQTHDDLAQQPQEDQDLTQQTEDFTGDDLTQQTQDLVQEPQDGLQSQGNQGVTGQQPTSDSLKLQTQDFLEQTRDHEQTYQPQDEKKHNVSEQVEVIPNIPPVPDQKANLEDLDQQVQQDNLDQKIEDDLTQQTDREDLSQQIQQEDFSKPQQPLSQQTDSEDLTQQIQQEDFTKPQQPLTYQDLTRQTQTNDDLTQQTQTNDDLTQQTQTNDDLTQQTQTNDDLTQQTQTNDDLTQQIQQEDFGKLQQSPYPSINQQPFASQTYPNQDVYFPKPQAQLPAVTQDLYLPNQPQSSPISNNYQPYRTATAPQVQNFQVVQTPTGDGRVLVQVIPQVQQTPASLTSQYNSALRGSANYNGRVSDRVKFYENLNKQYGQPSWVSPYSNRQRYRTASYQPAGVQQVPSQQYVDNDSYGFAPLHLGNERAQSTNQPDPYLAQQSQLSDQQALYLTQQPVQQQTQLAQLQQNRDITQQNQPLQIQPVQQNRYLPQQPIQQQSQLAQLQQNQQNDDLTQQPTQQQLPTSNSAQQNEFAPLQIGSQQSSNEANQLQQFDEQQLQDVNFQAPQRRQQLVQQQAEVLANQQDDDLTQKVEDVQPIQTLTGQESEDLNQREINSDLTQRVPRLDNQQLSGAELESQKLIDLLKQQKRVNDERNQATIQQQSLPYPPKPLQADSNGQEVPVGKNRQIPTNYAAVQNDYEEANTETVRDIKPIEPQVANQVQDVVPASLGGPLEDATTKKPGFWSRLGSSIKNKIG